MAKQAEGTFGGFRGKLGPLVGYEWNGIWCVRTRPERVPNPKTKKQTEHREMFKRQVQLASRMRWAVAEGLTLAAKERHMTGHNLFVKLNQQAFSTVDGELAVDYSRLQVSAGGLAPVAFGEPSVGADNVLSVSFVKNPTHSRADGFDSVKLYLYCPDAGMGFVSNGDYRNTQRCALVLPGWMMGHEVHLYGFVRNTRGFCSDSQYIGTITPQDGVASNPATAAEPAVSAATLDAVRPLTADGLPVDPATGEILANEEIQVTAEKEEIVQRE